MRVKIICRTKVLHKEDDEEEEIKLDIGECCCRKKIANFLNETFWEYYYGEYISIIENSYVVFLPPEFYINIPGYIWS